MDTAADMIGDLPTGGTPNTTTSLLPVMSDSFEISVRLWIVTGSRQWVGVLPLGENQGVP